MGKVCDSVHVFGTYSLSLTIFMAPSVIEMPGFETLHSVCDYVRAFVKL